MTQPRQAKTKARARAMVQVERVKCSYCKRAQSVCICNYLPQNPLKTSVKVIVLQHPNEVKKGLTSSIPLVRLCHQDTVVIRGVTFDSSGNVSRSFGRTLKNNPTSWWLQPFQHEDLAGAFIDIANNPPLLLYPSEDALDLDDFHDFQFGDEWENAGDSDVVHGVNNNQTTLIVIDGTWAEAKRICRRSPTILRDSIPVKFTSSTKSIINEIRRGNKDNFLSSLEAIAFAIKKIDTSRESHECSAAMLQALAAVVDKQLHEWGKNTSNLE